MIAVLVSMLLAGGGQVVDASSWDGVSVRIHVDDVARLKVPVPLTGVLVQSRHFPEATAAQMRHVLTVFGTQGEVVELGVFENPRHFSLTNFIKETLDYLGPTALAEIPWTVTAKKVSAVLYEYPRSDQQYAARVAVFALGQRIFVVSCRNVEDRFALGAFAAMLDGLEVLP